MEFMHVWLHFVTHEWRLFGDFILEKLKIDYFCYDFMTCICIWIL